LLYRLSYTAITCLCRGARTEHRGQLTEPQYGIEP
jgi:hypothetical protein